jgi:hypothetical protein
MLLRWILAALVGLTACNEAPPPPPAKKEPPKKPAASSWKEIETPVPVGKKLACASALPTAKLSASLGRPVELIDDSARDPEATSVCRVMNVDKKGKVADEECLASVYCWSAFNVAEMKKRCDARGESSSTSDVGVLTCVQKVHAGDYERHVVTALDADTRCKVVVNAAPKQYDLEQTKACARAVVEALDADGLRL